MFLKIRLKRWHKLTIIEPGVKKENPAALEGSVLICAIDLKAKGRHRLRHTLEVSRVRAVFSLIALERPALTPRATVDKLSPQRCGQDGKSLASRRHLLKIANQSKFRGKSREESD